MPTPKDPGNVPEELRDFFENKSPKPAWSYREVWGEEHKMAFTVAKVLEADLLEVFREAVIRAQNEGVPFKQWARDLTPVLQEAGWWGRLGLEPAPGEGKESRKRREAAKARRLEVIYDTNLRMSRAHGQWERIQRRKKFQPYLRYRLGPSEKHRPEHVAFDGLVYPVDHPFWQTNYPPNGYGCRCFVEQLTRASVEGSGGPSEDLDPRLFPLSTYRDPRSGTKRSVPYGVSPGFEFPPGLSGRTSGTRSALAKRK